MDAVSVTSDETDHAAALYTAYRNYLSHEDDLIHQRTTWSITIQSFTIATFGLTFQKKMEILARTDPGAAGNAAAGLAGVITQYDHFLIALAGFGLGVALISGASVFAAQKAIRRLIVLWQSCCSRNSATHDFPLLTGGGSRTAHHLGHMLPLALPVFFVLFWTLIALYIWVDGPARIAAQ
jgi:hypothetical protein